MARTRYAPDRGLTARMTLTMFLLGLVFVAFVAALVGILTAVHASGGAIIFFPVLLGLGLGIGSLFFGCKIQFEADSILQFIQEALGSPSMAQEEEFQASAFAMFA